MRCHLGLYDRICTLTGVRVSDSRFSRRVIPSLIIISLLGYDSPVFVISVSHLQLSRCHRTSTWASPTPTFPFSLDRSNELSTNLHATLWHDTVSNDAWITNFDWPLRSGPNEHDPTDEGKISQMLSTLYRRVSVFFPNDLKHHQSFSLHPHLFLSQLSSLFGSSPTPRLPNSASASPFSGHSFQKFEFRSRAIRDA